MRRPSPATILALIALAATWTTSAVAARLLTGQDVRDRSLTGKDLRSNSVTGRVVAGLSGRDIVTDTIDGTDVLESSLGEVPSARRAGRADTATQADAATTAASLNGARLERVAYARPVNPDTATIFDAGGLRLRARCTGAGDLAVTAATTGSSFVRTASTVRSGNSTTPAFAKDDDFTPGEEFNVLAGGHDNVQGQLSYYAADGAVVTLTFLAESGIAGGRNFSCLFAATAVHTPA